MRGLRNAFDAWSESLKCSPRERRRAWKLASLACGRGNGRLDRVSGRGVRGRGGDEEETDLHRGLVRSSRDGRDPKLGECVEPHVRRRSRTLYLAALLPLALLVRRRSSGLGLLGVAVRRRLRGGAVWRWRGGRRAPALGVRGGRGSGRVGGRGGKVDADEGGRAARGGAFDAVQGGGRWCWQIG